MSQKYCLVYTTCPKTGTKAKEVAKKLVSKKLAACVNIINDLDSIYFWDNKIQNDKERLLIIKTTIDLFDTVKQELIDLHFYECPEIIMVPILNGYNAYFSWMDSCLESNYCN